MSRTAWMIERNSVLWGAEWFCAGEKRWTKDCNKAIHFPCKDSATELWKQLHIAIDSPCPDFPYVRDGAGDWEYGYDATEHMWIEPKQEHKAVLLPPNDKDKGREP